MRGRFEQRDFKGRKGSRSKTKDGKKKRACFVCGSEEHLKKDCPNKKKNKAERNS